MFWCVDVFCLFVCFVLFLFVCLFLVFIVYWYWNKMWMNKWKGLSQPRRLKALNKPSTYLFVIFLKSIHLTDTPSDLGFRASHKHLMEPCQLRTPHDAWSGSANIDKKHVLNLLFAYKKEDFICKYKRMK